MDPADHNANATVNRLLDQMDQLPNMNHPETRELFDLLADQDMQAVLMAHDDIARKSFEPVQYPAEAEAYSQPPQPASNPAPEMQRPDDSSKVVTVRRAPGEPLVRGFLYYVL